MTAPTILVVSNGHVLVDEADAESLSRHRWFITKAVPGHRAYAKARIDGTFTLMHRLLMRSPAGCTVDHLNGDTLDNRRANLRIATRSQNAANSCKRVPGHSRYKGVTIDVHTPNRNNVRAILTKNGKWVLNRYFATEVEAAHAYDEAARKHFGEFARLNFPKRGERSALVEAA